MRQLCLAVIFFISYNANAEIVYTSPNVIDEFWTWTESEAGVDGDVLIKLSTGVSECPTGVYLKNSAVAKNSVSTSLAAYMTNKRVVFQIWNDSSRFWNGSKTPYCQVRAIRLPK